MVGIRGVSGSPAARPARGAHGTGFTLGAMAAAEGGAAAQGIAATAAAGLLALQESAPAAERDARARRRGAAMLDELARLQADLLAGRAEPGRLEALAALAGGDAGADPALAAAVAAIALRVRIELARRGHAAFVSQD